MKKIIFLPFLIMLSFFQLNAQIIINNTVPYDIPIYLVDSVLILDGVTASNISFQGDPGQIGFFNAINTPLGIDSGVVLATGDIYNCDPLNTNPNPVAMPNTVTDPDLLVVANSVPPLLPAPFTNTFAVLGVNDAAILEFDFITTSICFSFRYAFIETAFFHLRILNIMMFLVSFCQVLVLQALGHHLQDFLMDRLT